MLYFIIKYYKKVIYSNKSLVLKKVTLNINKKSNNTKILGFLNILIYKLIIKNFFVFVFFFIFTEKNFFHKIKTK